ncbi:DNA primase [Sphingomonas laterariae]|uniref:DNA primase n=1 Tax=Edaphosphingomonas laterariae TaxID=861865 RepID=A0A239BB14_9SPHN|nr:DNA primase [Sphingomonas laterariae]SNS04869.1 DNA primase [Sphingomonas laterariae]
MSLSPQFLDELRSRTLLSALVGKSVKLERAGREFRACCPFHNEKSPSFYVNDDKAFYHCFGCGAHGDAIRFLTDHKGLPFIDAVKELAAAAGMEVPAADPRAAEKAERASGLHDAMEEAARWFTEQLHGIAGAEARAYLAKRGVDAATQAAFGFGFAPDSRGKLKAALARFGDDKLVEAGLLIAVDGKEPYDRFRGRLMIPIRDARGRTIAFGGRIIGAGEPKYLNSPETPLFDKGRTLFNIDKAAAATRKTGRVIVVEGYMDVVALAQAGLGEAVAPLGTALTEGQLERLWRMAETPVLCFDGDAAGQKAAIRAALRALPMIEPGRTLRFATLPAGQDPDDLVRAGGPAAMEAVLEAAEPLVERLWKYELGAAPLDTPEARAGMRKRLADHAGTIRHGDVRGQYLADFRRRFDSLYERTPPARFQPGGGGRRGGIFQRGKPPEAPPSAATRTISSGGVTPLVGRAVLAGLLRHPQVIADQAEAVAALPLPDPALANLRNAMLDAAFGSDALDSQALGTILAQVGLAGAMETLRAPNGLAFSFLRGNAESGRARRDLAAAIEALAARPELDAALATVTARLMASPDEAGFAEQRRLRAARDEADQALAKLAAGEDDAGL